MLYSGYQEATPHAIQWGTGRLSASKTVGVLGGSPHQRLFGGYPACSKTVRWVPRLLKDCWVPHPCSKTAGCHIPAQRLIPGSSRCFKDCSLGPPGALKTVPDGGIPAQRLFRMVGPLLKDCSLGPVRTLMTVLHILA